MLEKLNGQGQGCCDACCLLGWHIHWTSMLFHIRNSRGMLLRRNLSNFYPEYCFENSSRPAATFCYKHALMIDEVRKHRTDY